VPPGQQALDPRRAVALHHHQRVGIVHTVGGVVAVELVAGTGAGVDQAGDARGEGALLDARGRDVFGEQARDVLEHRSLDQSEGPAGPGAEAGELLG
jgi:hypothetical protein